MKTKVLRSVPLHGLIVVQPSSPKESTVEASNLTRLDRQYSMSSIAYVIAALAALFLLYQGSRMGARRFSGSNDGETAKRLFLFLLDQAERDLIIYDDGNDVEDSIYANEAVLDALEAKLRHEPDFTVRCLFNCDGPQQLHDRFDNEPRFTIRTTGLGEKAPRDLHLKVADRGRMAYLTQHEFNSTTRLYELVDCLTVWKRALGGVAREELGDCIDVFDQRFADAA